MEKSNERTQSVVENWEKATLSNNFLFCKIMSSDPELCRGLLETLLEIEIDHLEKPVPEMTLQEGFDTKTVRFDVFTKNSKQVFDIEMQTTKNSNLSKRARYYQSVIDMDSLQKGENYRRLKDSYVIFLCLEDVFAEGLPVYKFENICLSDSKNIKLNDRSFKIFFNAAKYDKLDTSKKRNFFKFLKGGSADDDFSKRLEKKVLLAKKNFDWRRQYMTWEQELEEKKEYAREEGFEEGLSKGEQTAKISASKRLLKMRILSVEQIVEATGLPEEDVRKLASKLEN